MDIACISVVDILTDKQHMPLDFKKGIVGTYFNLFSTALYMSCKKKPMDFVWCKKIKWSFNKEFQFHWCMNKAAPNIKATANKYDWQIIAVKSQCILQQIHYFTAKYQQIFFKQLCK